MAVVSITIPDQHLTRVVEAMAAVHGWTAQTGLTKAQFARRVLVETIRNAVKQHEAQQAAEAARATAVAAVDADLDVTASQA